MGNVRGLVGRVLSFVRATRSGAKLSDTTFDPGGGRNLIGDHFSAPGDDAYPLGTDFLYAAPEQQSGRYAVLGYVDPVNAPKAAKGEKRIYARDSGGTSVVELWLKADGTAVLSNADGSVTMGADGHIVQTNANGSITLNANGQIVLTNAHCSLTLTAAGAILGQTAGGAFSLSAAGAFTVNGVTIDAGGAMNVPTSLVLAGKQIAGHSHAQGPDSHGDSQTNTGPNL